jgi:hypothetical protein
MTPEPKTPVSERPLPPLPEPPSHYSAAETKCWATGVASMLPPMRQFLGEWQELQEEVAVDSYTKGFAAGYGKAVKEFT